MIQSLQQELSKILLLSFVILCFNCCFHWLFLWLFLDRCRISVERGSLQADFQPEPYHIIDVLGKTPEDVVNAILNHVGENSQRGALIVLCGLSGTG